MSSSKFLATLVDSIAPGGVATEAVTLPPASLVGCDLALAAAMSGSSNLRAIVEVIAERAGSAEAFVGSKASVRADNLETVQRDRPDQFASLVTVTQAHYYTHPQVLAALNWPARPPQPAGHALPPFDEGLLAPVRARGAIWREC
ncbi:MAG: hypothetical protein U1E67_02965 [Hyphomicrobiales bacterium]